MRFLTKEEIKSLFKRSAFGKDVMNLFYYSSILKNSDVY